MSDLKHTCSHWGGGGGGNNSLLFVGLPRGLELVHMLLWRDQAGEVERQMGLRVVAEVQQQPLLRQDQMLTM